MLPFGVQDVDVTIVADVGELRSGVPIALVDDAGSPRARAHMRSWRRSRESAR
jgi:hypothetical protein